MKKFSIFLLTILFTTTVAAQYNFPFASAENRTRQNKFLRDSIIRYRLQNFSDPVDEEKLRGAFWAMELMLFKDDFSLQQLQKLWKNFSSYSESFQKSLLEVSYTLYPKHFTKDIKRVADSTSSPALFVRSAEYVLRADVSAAKFLRNAIKRFDPNIPQIEVLSSRLNKRKEFLSTAALKILFSKQFLKGQTIIYSIQRADRNYPGLILIRNNEGNFIQSAHQVFSVPQLARSITDYPFYITNGNTPQGIYKWTGFDSSSNNYIGPTTNLQMVMPYEIAPETFLVNTKDWSKEVYASLLPPALQNQESLFESFYAGKAGRSEIIMHGTTIDPSYYVQQPYFPNTPSLGCLCSYEEWSKEGVLKKSNQLLIVEKLKSQNLTSGFVVVIELNNKKSPVTISELLPYLR